MNSRLISIHPMDPRGAKVGGMETHVRQLLSRHPADMNVLMVGIDERGDLELGRTTKVSFQGREFEFVPIMRAPVADQTGAAKTLTRSLTFRFAAALLQYLPRLRSLVTGSPVAVEVERFEFAPMGRVLGPLVVMVHNEGDPKRDKMDSLLSRYWWINDAAEWIAFRLARRIFCVTPKLKERLATRHPSQAAKADVLTVSVDTNIFRATPFDLKDGKLKVVYAGRLDEFKDPALMFRVAKRVHEKLNGAFEFHYCGASDPNRFGEFKAIEGFTVRHGALLPEGVAAVMRSVHMGILVSHWEGMPCFLLELLSSGRPFAGLRLPQFDQVVKTGISGRMVERADTVDVSTEAVAQIVVEQWADIKAGRIDPTRVHEQILPFSVDRQLERLFDALRAMQQGGGRPPVAAIGRA
ncbi:MAG: glycosyltransferase [Alphaproteobacteria bacterium]|nr:glycosyltransferase [Alphaproteobacteria bacterium]